MTANKRHSILTEMRIFARVFGGLTVASGVTLLVVVMYQGPPRAVITCIIAAVLFGVIYAHLIGHVMDNEPPPNQVSNTYVGGDDEDEKPPPSTPSFGGHTYNPPD